MIHVFATVVESPFAFFEMQIEQMFVNASETVQPDLCEAPEGLDTVDVRLAPHKLTLAVLDAEVLLVAEVHKAVIASPAVRMDDAADIHPSSNNGLQTASLHIRDDFRVDLPVALEESEDNRLSTCAAPALAPHATRTEVGFVHLNLTAHRRSPFRIFRNLPADCFEIAVHRHSADAGELGDFRCL